MKKLILLTALLFSSCATNKPTLKPNEKIKLYYIYRHDCPACHQMNQTLNQPDIKNILSKKFKLIKVNFTNQNILPNPLLKTNKTPTLYFLNSSAQHLHKPIHNTPPQIFKQILQNM